MLEPSGSDNNQDKREDSSHLEITQKTDVQMLCLTFLVCKHI
jgi:hypothetical protein